MAEPDPRELFFSNLGKHWLTTRDTIESFASILLSPAADVEPRTGPELIEKGFDFGGRMYVLWLEGLGIVADEALRRAAQVVNEESETVKAERKKSKKKKKAKAKAAPRGGVE